MGIQLEQELAGGADDVREALLTGTKLLLDGLARPVTDADGKVTVDPHLHQHVFVHNVTYDEVEGRWKAMKERAILERAVYFEANFEARFARNLYLAGLRLDRRGKSWDIVDISPEMAARYSLRTQQVEELKAQLGVTSGKLLGELGARSRSSKSLVKDLDLKDHLRERSPEDYDACLDVHRRSLFAAKYAMRDGPMSPNDRAALAEEAVDYALEKAFERRSTAHRFRIVADAVRYAGAGRCLPADVEQALAARPDLIFGNPDKTHKVLVTTQEIVEQEIELMQAVRDGRDDYAPLVERPRIDRELSAEQMAAVTHVLSSTDQVMLVEGKAGVGKSFLLQALVRELNRNDVTPVALAPTVSASRGALRDAGLTDANTLARAIGEMKTPRKPSVRLCGF